MPVGQVTITGKTGPNVTNTAIVHQNVQVARFDLMSPILQLQIVTGAGDNIKEYDLTGVTTVTCTITGGVFAFVLS